MSDAFPHTIKVCQICGDDDVQRNVTVYYEWDTTAQDWVEAGEEESHYCNDCRKDCVVVDHTVQHPAPKVYNVEFISKTYRSYNVTARSEDEARECALEELESDNSVSSAWREGAQITDVEVIT